MKRRNLLIGLATVAMITALLFLWPSSGRSLIPDHQCNFCHNMHGAPGFTLLNNTQVEALCLTCHGPGGISTLKAEVHQNEARSSYDPFRISCRGCHDPHDNLPNWRSGVNIKLVGTMQDATGLAKVIKPNSTIDTIRHVVFESRGTDAGQPSLHSFADSDQDLNGYYDGACETCHTLTGHHRNNAPDTQHHTGETCTRCHDHTNYFLR